MHCEIVEPGASAWSSALQQVRHDFYHRPEYVRICAEELPGALPRAFIASDDDGVFFMPFLLREIHSADDAQPLWDAITPYGYSTLLIHVRDGADPSQFLKRAIDALGDFFRRERIISLFVRMHPLLPIPLEPLAESGTLVTHGETVFINLERSPEELESQTEREVRRRSRRAKDDGLVAEVDSAWEALPVYEEIYAQTMRRVDAAPEYDFSHDYYAMMQSQLGDCMHLLLVRYHGEIIAASLFSEINGIVQHHLCGRRDGFERVHSLAVMLTFARDWFKARGNQLLHMGGGVGSRADSVFKFKTHFSPDRALFHTWRLVTDQQAYQELVNAWEHEADALSAGPTGFFPEYRAPHPKAQEAVASCTEVVAG